MKLIKKKYQELFGQELTQAENLNFKDLTEKEKEELKELYFKEIIDSWIDQALNKLYNADFDGFLFDYGYNYFYDFAVEIMKNEKNKKFYYKNCFKLDDIITDFVVYDFINGDLNY